MKSWPIIGHQWAVRRLQLAVQQDNVPHALLITGAESVGKTTLAHTLAKAMLCTAPAIAERPCGECSACHRVVSGNHPDLLIREPETEGRGVKIDQIRELQRFMALTPNESRYKVAIITDFERATSGASNALLKTLEEPPGYAHLILLATSADLLLPTIVSRSQQLSLRPLDRQTIAAGLQAHYDVHAEQVERLARLAGGRIGWAIRSLTDPDHLEEMELRLTQLLDLVEADLPTRFDAAQELSQDDATLKRLLAYWRTGWRDVLLLQTDTSTGLTHVEKRDSLEKLAAQVDVRTTSALLRTLDEAEAALRKNANTRLLVEWLMLQLPQCQLG